MVSEQEIAGQLLALIRAKTGDPSARIGPLTTLPGHAGQSYSFEFETGSGATAKREKLVLRLAPEGVRPVGTADVVRQARIMKSLEGSGVPVPPIRWLDDDPAAFGRPYFVVGFVDGDKLAMGEREHSAADQQRFARSIVEKLAILHSVHWEPLRPIWGDPRPLREEMERFDALLDRPQLDPKTTAGSAELRERLRATMPPAPQIGCVHGDFQWSNSLCAGDGVQVVIDWELAQIGAVLIDLGWLCLFSDRKSWADQSLIPPHAPSPEDLADLYRKSVSWPVSDADLRWFRAFAGYRFGAITAFNLMLHRRGKRPDPTWEDIALSSPLFFGRGRELLG
jgi:aminoglycoside phosphotransferase (APT) family kinase protein